MRPERALTTAERQPRAWRQTRDSQSPEAEGTGKPPGRKPKVWLWPNILSLDAPLVAVVWQILFSRTFRAHIHPSGILVLAFGTWLIYVADRILDGLHNQPDAGLTARHRFYRQNRRRMFPSMGVVLAATIWLSVEDVSRAVLIMDLVLGFLVFLYLIVVHLAPAAVQRRWPKEFLVALLFATGTIIPTWTDLPLLGMSFDFAFFLFAATLWVNALGIECWERAPNRTARTRFHPGITKSLALHLGPAALVIGATAAYFASSESVFQAARPIYLAIAISALLLAGLECLSDHIPKDLLRVFADIALLAPVLLFPFFLRI